MNAISANDIGMPAVNRRSMLLGMASVAAGSAFASSAMSAPSRLTGLVEQWSDAWDNWLIEAMKPEAGNYDTPGCLHWEAMRDQAVIEIRNAPIRSDEDARALAKFVWLDTVHGNDDDDCTPQVQRWALERLMGWLGVPV